MKIVLLSTLILLLIPGSMNAQTAKIARLQQDAALASDQKERVLINLQILNEHESLFRDSLLPLAERTLQLAQTVNEKRLIGEAQLALVCAFFRKDEAGRADSVIQNSIPGFSSEKADEVPIRLRLQLAHTIILAAGSDYERAVKELFEIIRLAERTRDTPVLARCFNELGVIAYNRDQLDDALGYYRRSLSLGDEHAQADLAKAYSWINIAMVHGWREQYDSALYYINLAKPLCERIENLYYLANALAVEANIYKWSKRLPQAELAMLRMVALREKTEGTITFSNEQLSLANFYVYAGDCAKAVSIYKAGLNYEAVRRWAVSSPNFELELRYFEGLAKCYVTLGDREKYASALLQIIALKDSLYAKNSAEAIAEMQTKYEVQKKETTIIAQKLDLTRKNVLFYGSLLFIALSAIIGWLIFRSYRRKAKMRLFLMQEEEKRMAQQAVKNAEEAERKRIAADLHDSLGSYAASIKSNADEMRRAPSKSDSTLELLQSNAQQMVSLLSDTIWAMRKESLKLSDISDRSKVVVQRLRSNYPAVRMLVTEKLEQEAVLPPVHAYHVFMILQEALNNALRHSGADAILLHFEGGENWFVSVTDNGTGFENAAAFDGNGLMNMRNRAAAMNCRIEWRNRESGGTEVRLVPNSD